MKPLLDSLFFRSRIENSKPREIFRIKRNVQVPDNDVLTNLDSHTREHLEF